MSGSVTSIEYYTFARCNSLTSITIPDNIKRIGAFAFRDCTTLTSITFVGTIPWSGFDDRAFGSQNLTGSGYIGNLRDTFYATDQTNGTPGTYTRASGSDVWEKQ